MRVLKKRFGVIDRDVLIDPLITTQEKALYCLLCCYADKRGYCYPGINSLAVSLNVGERVISKWLAKLVKSGIIEREHFSPYKTRITRIIDGGVAKP